MKNPAVRLALFPVLLVLLAACGGGQEPGTEAPPAEPPEGGADPRPAAAGDGQAAPSFALETLDHGRFDLAEQRGHWVVVNFWATWCTPCLEEIPDLSALAARREDVRVIGLAYEEIEPEAMRDFLQAHPAGYPVAILDIYDPPPGIDPPRGLPLTWLVAPDGGLVRRFLGPVTSEDLEAEIAAHAGPAGEAGA